MADKPKLINEVFEDSQTLIYYCYGIISHIATLQITKRIAPWEGGIHHVTKQTIINQDH